MYSQQGGMAYPILGLKTDQELQNDLYQAIKGEATDAEFYSRLVKDAPNELHREFIEHAHNDELKHLYYYDRLYRSLFGEVPRFRLNPTQYQTYKEGLLIALRGELHGAEFYRDMQLSVKDPIVRDTFYLAMTDELEHATRFSTLYNTI
jgi:rubrerythrin